MELKSKFSIGDIVYQACIERTRKFVDCPDCLGQSKWKVISPAGDEFTFSCPRCQGHNRDLEYWVNAPYVRKLTIGSIRIDTADKQKPISYMCNETGVGSGSVYDEATLFLNEEQAFEAANIQANLETSNDAEMIQRYNKAITLSIYSLSGAQNPERLAKANYCPAPSLRRAWEKVRANLSDDFRDKPAVTTLNKFFTRGLSSSSE